ncbi:MAG: hypothetical protein M3Z00_06485 [Actinomycetota bacterium]|nr:hypothetical protein [Actinomycetota bacterium]
MVLGGADVFGAASFAVFPVAAAARVAAVPLPCGAAVEGLAVVAGRVVAAGGVVERTGAGAESTGCAALLRCDVGGALVVGWLVTGALALAAPVIAALDLAVPVVAALVGVGALFLLAWVVVFGLAVAVPPVESAAALDVSDVELVDEATDVNGLVASTPVSCTLLGVDAPASGWEALPGLRPLPALLITNHTRPISTTTAAPAASDRRSQYTLGDRGPTGCITNPTVASRSC